MEGERQNRLAAYRKQVVDSKPKERSLRLAYKYMKAARRQLCCHTWKKQVDDDQKCELPELTLEAAKVLEKKILDLETCDLLHLLKAAALNEAQVDGASLLAATDVRELWQREFNSECGFSYQRFLRLIQVLKRVADWDKHHWDKLVSLKAKTSVKSDAKVIVERRSRKKKKKKLKKTTTIELPDQDEWTVDTSYFTHAAEIAPIESVSVSIQQDYVRHKDSAEKQIDTSVLDLQNELDQIELTDIDPFNMEYRARSPIYDRISNNALHVRIEPKHAAKIRHLKEVMRDISSRSEHLAEKLDAILQQAVTAGDNFIQRRGKRLIEKLESLLQQHQAVVCKNSDQLTGHQVQVDHMYKSLSDIEASAEELEVGRGLAKHKDSHSKQSNISQWSFQMPSPSNENVNSATPGPGHYEARSSSFGKQTAIEHVGCVPIKQQIVPILLSQKRLSESLAASEKKLKKMQEERKRSKEILQLLQEAKAKPKVARKKETRGTILPVEQKEEIDEKWAMRIGANYSKSKTG